MSLQLQLCHEAPGDGNVREEGEEALGSERTPALSRAALVLAGAGLDTELLQPGAFLSTALQVEAAEPGRASWALCTFSFAPKAWCVLGYQLCFASESTPGFFGGLYLQRP